MERAGRVSASRGTLAVVLAGLTGVACYQIRTVCPAGTDARRRIYSGGAEAEWCHRDDGVHQGPEVRYFESGDPMSAGAYLDGVRQGEWRYYLLDRRAWRREKWEDGAVVAAKVELPQRSADGEAPEVMAPTQSNTVKLASADPELGRAARASELPPFAVWYGDGKPRVLGAYDGDGLRTRTWRYWYEGGVLAREVTYDAGVRHGPFREWSPDGRPRTDGAYADGQRDGRWRRWDNTGRLVSDRVYARDMVAP